MSLRNGSSSYLSSPKTDVALVFGHLACVFGTKPAAFDFVAASTLRRAHLCSEHYKLAAFYPPPLPQEAGYGEALEYLVQSRILRRYLALILRQAAFLLPLTRLADHVEHPAHLPLVK